MAIIEKDIVENTGLIKEMDSESMGMLMDVVQKDLYTKPIESSIRETFSNAYDAIKEKRIARSILKGESEVEDHFVTDSAKASKGSKFNPDYYDLVFLDELKDKVGITYTERDGDRDLITISDYGVGLGNGRLAGFMKPGFSSKRNSKALLGKYGLGSKSPLATNIDFYILESWYNGLYTKFMIYDNYYKCIVNAYEAKETTEIKGLREVDGEVVEAVEKVYWEETSRKNGVSLSFDVKKHNKAAFINAIKDQLLYFSDVLLYEEEDENGNTSSPITFAQVKYSSESFLISSNTRFTQPHILINNVNYGAVDFAELGINRKYGNVAIKAGSSDVDITASRESVKWTEKTRKYVLNAIEEASQEAGKALESELSSYANLIERYLKANATDLMDIMEGDTTVITELKKFSGEVKLNVKMKLDTTLISSATLKAAGFKNNEFSVVDMLRSVSDRVTIHNLTVKGSKISASLGSSNGYVFENLIFRALDHHKGIDSNTVHYLAKGDGSIQYVTFKEGMSRMLPKEEVADGAYKTYLKGYYRKEIYYKMFASYMKEWCKSYDSIDTEAVVAYAKEMMIESTSVIQVKEDSDNTTHIAMKSHKEKANEELIAMKKEKKILPYKIIFPKPYRIDDVLSEVHYFGRRDSREDIIRYKMMDAKVDNLINAKSTVCYGTTKDRGLLGVASYIAALNGKDVSRLDEEGIAFIQIAEANIKHFKQIPNIMHVNEFFKGEHSIDDGVLTMNGGPLLHKFMTNYRMQIALTKASTFFILGKGDKTYDIMFNIFNTQGLTDELQVMENIKQNLKRFTFSLADKTEDELKGIINNTFAKSIKEEESSMSSLFEMLENMTKLQDIPDVQDIEDESMKAKVEKFRRYDIDFYDKVLVQEVELFTANYGQLLMFCGMLASFESSSYMTNSDKEASKAFILGEISKFFTNLKK